MREILSSVPFFPEDSLSTILKEIELTLRSGRLIDGPYEREFEEKFAKYNQAKYAVAVNSGTASLEITLRHFNVKGKEVIVPTNTFISTPNAVIFAGGKPVFADMSADTLCIDIEDVKRKFTPKTAGLIVVHIAGLVCPQINELKEFCKEHNLFLIEDSAHAHGAMFNGKKAGSFGDAGCFSFYPSKVMTSGEGGMIITDDSALAQSARCMRTYGQNQQRQSVMLGHNWRLNEVAAIIGNSQLDNLEKFISKRNEIAHLYEDALKNIDAITLFKTPQNSRHSYYKYPVKLADGINREKLSQELKEKYGVEAGHVYYPPCHLHPFYIENFGTSVGNFPVAEKVLDQVLCLPMRYELSPEDIMYVRDAVADSIKKFSG